jgi:hypothetical protein
VDKVVFVSRDARVSRARDEMVSKLLYHAKIARDDKLIPEPREQISSRRVAALKAKERDPESLSFRGLCRIFESLYGIDIWAALTDVTGKRDFESYIHEGVQRDCYVLAYEDLVADRTAGLAEYLGVPVTVPAYAEALGRFGHTRRSGRAANWRSFFTGEDVEILRPLLSQMLPGDGRYADWDLAGQPHLEPAEVSGYVARIAAV